MSVVQQPFNPIGQTVTYVTEQVRGVTANCIHTDGFLGVIDKIWLSIARIKTIIIVGTLAITLLSMLIVALSGKKESFTAGASNVVDEIRLKAGQKVKKALYL